MWYCTFSSTSFKFRTLGKSSLHAYMRHSSRQHISEMIIHSPIRWAPSSHTGRAEQYHNDFHVTAYYGVKGALHQKWVGRTPFTWLKFDACWDHQASSRGSWGSWKPFHMHEESKTPKGSPPPQKRGSQHLKRDLRLWLRATSEHRWGYVTALHAGVSPKPLGIRRYPTLKNMLYK